ncbi:MAG TPA: hypothetical protein VGB77_22290 [Abditibacteriaceae bacterium]|jgi:hypothetical protein
MTQIKISDLDAATPGEIGNSDSFVVALESADPPETKKVSTTVLIERLGVNAKAPLASPALTGTPTAPTAAPGNNTTQISNCQFVMAALAAMVDSSPATLDTLNELAAALGDDPDFATTISTALGNKQPLDADLTAIAALTTTVWGRALLELANAAALRSAAGLDKEPICIFFSGKPLSGQTIKFMSGRPFTLPQNLTGSSSDAGTVSTGTTAFDIQKKVAGVWTSIGTASFAIGGANCTYTFPDAVAFAAGETGRIVAPASDATLANVVFLLLGTLT